MREFTPLNRHLLVKRSVEDKKEDSTFMLPEDYQAPKDPYEVVEVVALAEDCSLDVNSLDEVVVERSQVQTITVDETDYHLVLQNHVYGVLP